VLLDHRPRGLVKVERRKLFVGKIDFGILPI
jgi:hypothetical protein